MKKKVKNKTLTLMLMMSFFVIVPVIVVAGDLDYDNVCNLEGIKDAMKIIGYAIQLVRWIVPIILIVLGMVDFGKAAVANDDNEIGKAATTMAKRFIAAVVIFLSPTIILALLNFIGVTDNIEDKNNSQFGACTKCMFDPYNECAK